MLLSLKSPLYQLVGVDGDQNWVVVGSKSSRGGGGAWGVKERPQVHREEPPLQRHLLRGTRGPLPRFRGAEGLRGKGTTGTFKVSVQLFPRSTAVPEDVYSKHAASTSNAMQRLTSYNTQQIVFDATRYRTGWRSEDERRGRCTWRWLGTCQPGAWG